MNTVIAPPEWAAQQREALGMTPYSWHDALALAVIVIGSVLIALIGG